MSALVQDLRFGLRMLGKNPGFTVVAVLTLALGIGANTTIFSIVDELLFAPLPFVDVEHLAVISEANDRTKPYGPISYLSFLDLRQQNQIFLETGALRTEFANFESAGEPEHLQGIRVTSGLLSLLHVKTALGRAFLPEEYSPGRQRVAILGHRLWQRRFDARADVVGTTITLEGHPHIVVGVFQADFNMGRNLGFEPDFWVPVGLGAAESRATRDFIALGRLKPGISMERAQADLDVISRRMEKEHPETQKGWRMTASSLRGEVDAAAYILLALVITSVLGIACINVTNLLLARAGVREREISIRAALGAGRIRIIRQLLTEGLLLALAGGVLGTALAYAGCNLISKLAAGSDVSLLQIGISGRVLAATLGVLVLTGVGVGLVPALRLSKVNLAQNLKEGIQGTPGKPARISLRKLLVISELALSLTLLIGAGLVIKSWFGLWHMDLGFQPRQVLTLRISLPAVRYDEGTLKLAFFEDLLGRLHARPEVKSAAIADSLPTGSGLEAFFIEGRPRPEAGEEPQARLTAASYRYFETLSIPVKAGRGFADTDAANALPVAVTNEALALKYWNRENPLGARIAVAGKSRTVVGVVGNVKTIPLSRTPVPELYVPYTQQPEASVALLVKTALDEPLDIAQAVKKEVQAVDPHQAVSKISTLEGAITGNMRVINLGSLLMGVLGVGALILATVGIYGVLSYSVSRHTRDFGIHMALGARRGDVLRMVVMQGLVLIAGGIGIGVAASLAVGRLLASRIYGLRSFEAPILVGVTLLLLLVALAACYLPARRATKVDPIVALRYE